MAQGKLKNKVKTDKLHIKQKQKGKAFQRRANAPIKPKKSKHDEMQKLKNIVTKTVNKTVETEIRSRADPSSLKLSKAQEAVKKHSEKQIETDATAAAAAAEDNNMQSTSNFI